jgi:hypothetical protein
MYQYLKVTYLKVLISRILLRISSHSLNQETKHKYSKVKTLKIHSYNQLKL